MIILSTSFHVVSHRQQEFLDWLRNHFDGLSVKPQLMRLLTVPSPDVSSYVMQLHFDNIESAEAWADGECARLLAELSRHWGEEAMYFTTFMETL